MRRFICSLAFVAALLFVPAGRLEAQSSGPVEMSPGYLAGFYTNTATNRNGAVYQQGRGYLFVNENGDRAVLTFTGTNRLGVAWSPRWDPRTVATVGRDGGRLAIRFDVPGMNPVFWVAGSRD